MCSIGPFGRDVGGNAKFPHKHRRPWRGLWLSVLPFGTRRSLFGFWLEAITASSCAKACAERWQVRASGIDGSIRAGAIGRE